MKEQNAKPKTPARADEKTTVLIKMREGDIQDGPASRAVGGSFIDEFNLALVNQTLRTFWSPDAPASDRDLWIKAARDLAACRIRLIHE